MSANDKSHADSKVRGKHAKENVGGDDKATKASKNNPRSQARERDLDASSDGAATTVMKPVTSSSPIEMPGIKPNGKKKMSKAKKAVLIILGVLVALIVAAGIAVLVWLNSLNSTLNDFEGEDLDNLQEVLVTEEKGEAYYVAILGSDAREGDTASRSDVTMLVRLDPSDGIVDLISIPRDTMVTIEGQEGPQKINAAYAYDGAAGATTALSEFAGVPIAHYVEVHFDELKEVVDLLGGIEVDIPQAFDAGNGGVALDAGEQVLNGEQALAYARERYNVAGGDFSRNQAQRIIITAIMNKVLQAPVNEIPGIINELARCVTTDYTIQTLVDLALEFKDVGLTTYSAVAPSYTLSQDGISFVGTRYDEWAEMMKRVDAGLDPKDTSAEIPEPQASSDTLGAATNGASPRDYKDIMNNGLKTEDVVEQK